MAAAGRNQYTASLSPWQYATLGVVVLMLLSVAIYILQMRLDLLEHASVAMNTAINTAQRLTSEQKKWLFSPSFADSQARVSAAVSSDNTVSTTAAAGGLTAVDCAHQPTVCLSDRNCTLLCQEAATKDYRCDLTHHLCVDASLPVVNESNFQQDNHNDEINSSHCDPRIGQYALLQGYNELGVAQWRCIALYPGWNDHSRYCEGGKVNLDVRQRPPSYRDCTCPPGTTRMVYRRSMLGQEAAGLPHCVKFPHLYQLDYVAV